MLITGKYGFTGGGYLCGKHVFTLSISLAIPYRKKRGFVVSVSSHSKKTTTTTTPFHCQCPAASLGQSSREPQKKRRPQKSRYGE